MTTLTVRMDEETKAAAAAVAHEYGFDLSSITRAFLRQVARERRIPIDVVTPLPNAETLESIADAQAIIARGEEGFDTADELLEQARS
ncbi:type II toxin-antitoxin system RelB/DinJ family antitoxin [Olsenella intestinalis]|uniref:type II toxin-antitoxin system RelB/DinJ family antitoxin n=1 Tax=Olsenella intestinalis TaxID=2930083 RepID=UPI00200E25A1|nr:type II toxin-antitoxin system RelB/DinJ family antitoxin [Olsenella intestinalis]